MVLRLQNRLVDSSRLHQNILHQDDRPDLGLGNGLGEEDFDAAT